MNSRLRWPLTVVFLTALTALASPSRAQLSASANAQLEAVRQTPDSAGTLIYRGDTYSQDTAKASPLFRYERRVAGTPNGLAAAHATSDATGRLIIVESAQSSSAYELQRFDVVNQQAGFSGSVLVSQNGRHLDYQLNDNGKTSTASEELAEPAVSGPSLFGFILKSWEVLKAGAKVPVRMIVVRDKTTYGFDVRFEKQIGGQVSFSIIPSSFIIRLAIAPMRVVFDEKTRNVVRYEGRVPPMELVSGKLKDLDARVEYASVAPRYR